MSPYPPSVVDRFIAWADRLPGPVWLFYGLLLIVLIVMINGVAWLAGSFPAGTFDLYRTSIPVYAIVSLALIHYLNRVAQRALAAFRPALEITDSDYVRLEYELTTLPRGRTWAALGLSLIFTLAFAFFTPYLAQVFRQAPLLFGVDVVIYVIVFALITVFLYHTLHQLRMVTRIHAQAKHINLFQPVPLYAFSGLTARTGIGVLLLNYFSILTDPATFVNPALYSLTIITSLLAVLCFVLPLKGIHDRIVAEKKRLQNEANIRLEASLQEVFRRADTQHLTGIDQLNLLTASLVTIREHVNKIPTWPWEGGTLAGFVSLFLLPFIVRLFVGLLIQLLS